MGTKRDFITEIEELRERTAPSDWDNGITKLHIISVQTSDLEEESDQHAYFIVAAVAALETYFRWEIRRLLDSGDPRYTENFRFVESLKISHELLIAIHGKRVTIGELAAHSAKFSNLDAINTAMNQLLREPFLDLVKDRFKFERRDAQEEDVVRFINATLQDLTRTFELRHIVCHEAHLNTHIGVEEVKRLCSSCYAFARASHHAISLHADPNAFASIREAYEAATVRVKTLDERLRAAEEQITSHLQALQKTAFELMQQSWRAYVKKEGEYNCSLNMNGNIGALREQLVTERSYKERLEDINNIAKAILGRR